MHLNLGLGEGIGAFLLDGVLRGHYQEGLGQMIGLVAQGDLALLHGFQQCRLHLGGGSVDLVGKDEIGEDGALVNLELLFLLGVDEGAGHVGWQQVGSELDAAEFGIDGLRQCADG